jgi:hypothetical protein
MVTSAISLYALKLWVARLLTALQDTERMPKDVDSYVEGIKLLDMILEGEKLYAEERVTKNLVKAGEMLLIATEVLLSHTPSKGELKGCLQRLTQLRYALAAIHNGDTVTQEQEDALRGFFQSFADVLQGKIYSQRRG